jgi:hypothetical protein
MKPNELITNYLNTVLVFLSDNNYRYISIRMENIKKERRALYKRLYKMFDGNVPVKLMSDGKELWVIKR